MMELIIKDATFVSFECFACGKPCLVLHQDFLAGGHYHCDHCRATVDIDEAQAKKATDLLYAAFHGLETPRIGK